MVRLTQLDPDEFRYLDSDDRCYCLGEYTARGRYGASETNQQIFNLKHRPNSAENLLYWKRRAVGYWGRMLAETNLRWDYCLENATFVPIPCSKPVGHPEYDDRMVRVLLRMAEEHPGLDIQQVLLQATVRESQHRGERLTPAEILQTLSIDPAGVAQPLKRMVIVVDDVITRGASFAAAKSLLTGLDDVEEVVGLFLAKTIHPPVEFDLDEAFEF
ncbi:phosphoribosyltransferase [Pseudomonas aeruginosa]|uniref:phosphoribosyltransferase n=1 Tax=Pseudomonas aeruginosa TaxID=287 RepID=UPI00345B29C9|nr:phosphoribosyltransferase [Pseudomonas aeruginosa]HCL3293557.1 phosphoribosyltransferase [Pseudomonas aeruginosa]